MYLEKLARGRDNNLNLLRFVAASLVLVSHSFPLSGAAYEPLGQWLGISMGELAVDVFFLISGFLVSNSLVTKQDSLFFFKARLVRIFPALWFMLLLTVFVLGPVFSTLSLSEYFLDKDVWRYLYKCGTLVSGVVYALPGVFEHNPYAIAVNGSLWTLPHELKAYIFLWLIWWLVYKLDPQHWFARFRMVFGVICVILLAMFLRQLVDTEAQTFGFGRVFLWIAMGVLASLYQAHIQIKGTIALSFVLALVVAWSMGHVVFQAAYVFCLPYLVAYLAYVPRGFVRGYNRLGDYSYGIYIYAFPIQQMVAAVYSDVSIMTMMGLSFALSLFFAVCSWHLIEEKFLYILKKAL